MGNQNEIIYIPGSKRFKGNSDKELFIQVPFKSTQQNYTQGDRTVLLNLAQRFDEERQQSNIFRIAGKITNIINNSVSGKTTYNPFKNDLYYLNPEKTINDAKGIPEDEVWRGYPQYKEFTFVREQGISGHTTFIPKSSSTYNWNIYISYPFSSDTKQKISYTSSRFGTTVGAKEVSEGIPFIIQNTFFNGKPMITFYCSMDHNLSIGEYVKLSFTVNGKDTFSVFSLGDEYYDSERRVFSIYNIGYGSGNFQDNTTGTLKRIIDINNTGETTSKYYIRLHKLLTSGDEADLVKGGFENTAFTTRRKLEYSGLTPNRVQRISYKQGNQVFTFSFDKDIDITGLKDNNSKPVTDLFVTILNKGYMGWFNKPYSQNDNTAIDIGWEFNFDSITQDDWWNHDSLDNKDNIPVASYVKDSFTFYYNQTLTEGHVLKGDICEWNDYEQKEIILSPLYHKYSFNPEIFQNNSSVDNPSGYAYRPHYQVPIRAFSDYIETGNKNEIDNVPEYSYYSQNDNQWRWRDLYPYGFTDGDGIGVDNPFINNSHYPFKNILFLQTPILRNTEGIYYQTINLPIVDDCE
jgi:hypothetical protein